MKIYKNICLVDTPYALSIYLLKMSMQDIERTLFIVGDSVEKRIISKIPHVWEIRNQSAQNDWKYMFKIRLLKYIKCLNFRSANLYAQDHLYIASSIIESHKYTLLPDAPNGFAWFEQSPDQPFILPKEIILKRRIKNLLSRGRMYNLMYGTNQLCNMRWIMHPDEIKVKYFNEREYELVDAEKLWVSISTEHKQFIMNVFGITSELLEKSKWFDCMILTQPFREDCGLNDDEQAELYSKYFERYPMVAVKVHPRDKFMYKDRFKSAYIIDTYAPMQLLSYMGMTPKLAITVSSSALSAMPESTKKIYLGTKVNHKIFVKYGDLYNN